METTRNMFKIALPIMLSASLFSGCYTQLASTREEEETGYNDNRSYATQESSDSTYNDNGSYYNDDYRRSCMGYYYSVPVWQSSYYDGCIYPTYWSYWDAWWLSPGWVYPAYYYGGYHPYYGGYWHGHDGYYAHNYSQPHGVRSGGYTRANYNGRNEFDFARSYNTNTGTLSAPSAGRVSSSATRAAGSVSTSTRTATSHPSGTYRSSSVGRSARTYSPSIQQPQYRNQSNGTRTRSARASSIRSYNAPTTRSSSSSARQATPSYSPAPSTRTAPAPSSAPSRDNGNGNSGSSGGGRSGGGRR